VILLAGVIVTVVDLLTLKTASLSRERTGAAGRAACGDWSRHG